MNKPLQIPVYIPVYILYGLLQHISLACQVTVVNCLTGTLACSLQVILNQYSTCELSVVSFVVSHWN